MSGFAHPSASAVYLGRRKENRIRLLSYCLLVLKAQRLAFNLAINEYLRGIPLCREGILPTGNHSHLPQLLEIKGFLPRCIWDSNRCSLWGQTCGSSHCHNCVLEACKDLPGSLKVEWLKGQTLRAGCWHAVFMCVETSDSDVIPQEPLLSIETICLSLGFGTS